MKSPFVKIYVESNNRDITDLIENFKYENTIEKDNVATLTVKQNYAFDAVDDDDLIAGKFLLFQFGFLGGLTSPIHKVKITDVDTNYAARVTMTIKCLDKGQDMKKGVPKKIWNGKKASDIAKEIATKYGLEADVDDTSRVYNSYPQGGKTDFEFLQELAGKESGGDYVFYINDDTLSFKKVDYKQAARITYTYGEDIVSFSPKWKETQQKGGGKKTKIKGFDPMNKKPVTGEAAAGNGDTKLGEWDVNGGAKFDINSVRNKYANGENKGGSGGVSDINIATIAKQGITPDSLPEGTFDLKGLSKGITNASDNDKVDDSGVEIMLPVHDKAEANDAAKKVQKTGGNPHKHKSGGPKILTANLKVEGNPLLKPTDIITIAGVGKRHQGNWMITKITHSIIANGPYIVDIDMNKNGTSKEGTKGAAKNSSVNKTKGKGDEGKQIPERIVHWDKDGNNKKILANNNNNS